MKYFSFLFNYYFIILLIYNNANLGFWGFGVLGFWGENFANHRQPVRHEVVTHVLGTERYLCLRAGQFKCMAERESANMVSVHVGHRRVVSY